MRSELVAGLVLGSLAMACGQVLVGGDYRGETLLTFSGVVVNELPPELLDFDFDKMRITVVWLTPDGVSTGNSDVRGVEISTTFPARYELHLYQPPPPEAIFEGRFRSDTPVAVAVPILYVDLDEDGLWDRGQEQIVGGSYDVVGVWAAGSGRFEGLDTFTSDTAVLIWETELDRGYQRMMGAVNWCGITNQQPDAPPFLLPAGDRATNLYVGPTWDALQAWSCEW